MKQNVSTNVNQRKALDPVISHCARDDGNCYGNSHTVNDFKPDAHLSFAALQDR